MDVAFGARGWSIVVATRAVACSAMAAAIVSAAAAQPVVYQSPADDGVDPGTPLVLSGIPAESLYLYVDAGPFASATGTPCVDGSGDEMCAFRFCVQTSGTVGVVDFVPDAGRDIVWRASSTELCATGGDAVFGEVGPVRVGELVLSSIQAGDAQLSEGEVVGANLALDPVPVRVLAVPEPGALAQLGAGIACLLGISRRRRAL